jgi:hypothetical protein
MKWIYLKSYKLFTALHQLVDGCDAPSASLATFRDRGVAVCIYRPAVTQQSGDSVLTLVYGYCKKQRKLYTREYFADIQPAS